jgi:hypothetical protein
MSQGAKKNFSSAIVLLCRDVGFEDEDIETFAEMEAARKKQDSEAFKTICSRFADVQFTPDNLFVLLQPNAADSDLDKESYFESMRDLARFVVKVCQTKGVPDFLKMNMLLTNIAQIIHDTPGASLPDIASMLSQARDCHSK